MQQSPTTQGLMNQWVSRKSALPKFFYSPLKMNWKNTIFYVQNLQFTNFHSLYWDSKTYSVNIWDMQLCCTTPAPLNVWVWNKSALQIFCINPPNMNWINRKISGPRLNKLHEALNFSFFDFFFNKQCRLIFVLQHKTQRSSSRSAVSRNCSGKRAGSGGTIFAVYCILYKELFLSFFGVWPLPIAPLKWKKGPWKKTALKSAFV